MCLRVRVHERVMKRHPELREEDVLHAWRNAFIAQERLDTAPGTVVALGVDSHGRCVEMIASTCSADSVLIYHAKTPPTDGIMVELGLE